MFEIILQIYNRKNYMLSGRDTVLTTSAVKWIGFSLRRLKSSVRNISLQLLFFNINFSKM